MIQSFSINELIVVTGLCFQSVSLNELDASHMDLLVVSRINLPGKLIRGSTEG